MAGGKWLAVARLAFFSCGPAHALGGGGPWERVGPWNIFDDKDLKGEAGTLACAASPSTNPRVIYAGGQNNGVSSGVLKSVDGGRHWTRNSRGLWDTRVLGVWVHPDDASGDHVFVGTHSGVYESRDGAASWELRNETKGWGSVMSFREGVIGGAPYVLANSQDGILTMPWGGGQWQKIAAPGAIASNAHLSVVVQGGETELLTCIGGWGGGKLYYGRLRSPAEVAWTGPLTLPNQSYSKWAFFPGKSEMWGRCSTPTECDAGVHHLGVFGTLGECQAAVNATRSFKVASYTYQHNDSSLGAYAGHCYAMSEFSFQPTAQAHVDSGRAPGLFPGVAIDCSNAAVDPHDRNHFLYSKGGQYRAWESKDGGKTVREFTNHDTGVYFVMIDTKGWFYTATQAGAFVSQDAGASWKAYHVIMHSRDGRLVDRVPHDYQRIVPDFRGDGIAFPSDQGLHIVNGSSVNLTSAVGDLKNAMALSVLIAPGSTPGARNLVVNMWDWDVCASWDDGATWAGWQPTEKSPGSCGEGGGGQGMGASGRMIMFHRNHWWASGDGGHNFVQGDLPGGAGSFDYVRREQSRSEPEGTCFALMDAPAELAATGDRDDDDDDDADDDDEDDENEHRDDDDDDEDEDSDDDDDEKDEERELGYWYRPDAADGGDDDEDEDEERNPARVGYEYRPGLRSASQGTKKYLMRSDDFGQTWNWSALPDDLQAGGLAVDPTTPHSLFALTASCLAHSTDQGRTWSRCSNATGLTGAFSKLLVKDSLVMFLLREGAVPLRTTDGGGSWHELSSCSPLFKYGATMDGSLSWSGNTLVLHGVDLSAVGREECGTSVWKSTNDGDDWIDETGDLVTISPGPGVWYEQDFYLVTRGEGVTVKRNFDVQSPDVSVI